MSKATITHSGETPSQEIIKKAAEQVTVTDARGRQLTIKKLKPLDRMRMSKAAGAANSTNQPYMLYALVASSLTSIDGEDMLVPINELQLEAAISRLGEDGYDAAVEAVASFYGALEGGLTRGRKKVADDRILAECLYLVSKGIPFDVAFSLDDATRLGWTVIIGTQSTERTFDWSSMMWR